MKKIFILPALLTVTTFFTSCNYLNVNDYFEDTFMVDSVFSNQYNITRYFNGAVSLLPSEGFLWHWGSTPGITGSDEGVSNGTFTSLVQVGFSGTELTRDAITASSMSGWMWDFNIWPNCYKIIRKVNTMLPYINDVYDMNAFDKSEFRARCRFLRAYAYYRILMQNGPMILLGDEVIANNETVEYYDRARNTYDECVDYICSEFEAAAENLPESYSLVDIYNPTKGAALALSARVRLQAASPLYNGGSAARRYFGSFVRSTDGEYYVSQTYDARKWAVAAAAAKKVMDLGLYSLHIINDEDFTVELPDNVPTAEFPDGVGWNGYKIDPYRSYAEMFNGETAINSITELIWGTSLDTGFLSYVFPLQFGGSSAVSVPQRMIDQFYMADGRDINNASEEYPYEARPYDRTCVVNDDKQLSVHYRLTQGTYKAYANREPRFYVNIGYSGTYWEMTSTEDNGRYNQIIQYHYGGNAGKNQRGSDNLHCLTGYVGKKYVHPSDALLGTNARIISKTYPLIRYAEILLSYAEALNNIGDGNSYEIDGQVYTRDLEAIKQAFNQVRYRAGLPGITDSDLATVDGFNEIIQRERLIEFFHEDRRFYDVRRWGIVEDLENEPLTGCNVDQSEWEGYYQPIVIQHQVIRERTFKSKMVLLPLHLDEVRRVSILDQNPGWED